MSWVLIALSLSAAATLVACEGDARMTVREYADACLELRVKFDQVNAIDNLSVESLFQRADIMEEILTELRSWNPPEELQKFHGAWIISDEARVEAIRDQGTYFNLMEELESANEEGNETLASELLNQMSELEGRMSERRDDIAGSEGQRERERILAACPRKGFSR